MSIMINKDQYKSIEIAGNFDKRAVLVTLHSTTKFSVLNFLPHITR